MNETTDNAEASEENNESVLLEAIEAILEYIEFNDVRGPIAKWAEVIEKHPIIKDIQIKKREIARLFG